MNNLIKISVFVIFIANLSINTQASTFKVVNSNTNSITIVYKSQNVKFDTIFTSNKQFTILPVLDDTYMDKLSSGSPSRLIASEKITVPDAKSFHIDYIKIHSTDKFPNLITPIPALFNESQMSSSDYYLDFDKYASNQNEEVVKVNYIGIARNRHIATIDILAAYFNNSDNSICIPRDIEIRISFDSKNLTSNSNQINENEFPSTLNHFQTKDWIINTYNDIKLQGNNNNNKISELSNGQWLKIAIDNEGVYKIDATQLNSMGFNVSNDLVKTIKIFGNGGEQLSELPSDALKNNLNEQSIIVKTNSSGALENIIFYAKGTTGFRTENNKIVHYKHDYAITNYYLMTFGGRDGLRAIATESPIGIPVSKPTTYVQRIYEEEELTNLYPSGGGRQWFGRSFFSNPFVNLLNNLDRNGNILYRIAVAQRAGVSSGFDFYEGQEKMGSISLGRISDYVGATWDDGYFTLPANKIASDNRSLLKLNYLDAQVAGSTGYFDFYEIHYPRSFVALNNEIGFISDSATKGIIEYDLNGFSSDIYGLETTNLADPKLLKNDASTGGMFIFKANTSQGSKNFFFSSNPKNVKIEKISFKNLRENFGNTQVILITHQGLLESAEKYKAYRESTSNLKVTIVTVQDIYNEFSSGVPDIVALRDYLAYCYNNWTTKPEYVILWGDGHYDYKNIATKKTNYVPAYQTYDFGMNYLSESDSSFATDDFLAKILGNDDLVDIKIGRLTVDSPEIAFWMVEKIKHYEQNSSLDNWRANAILVADDGPASYTNEANDGADHTNMSEILSRLMIPDLQQSKLYLVEYPSENVPGGIRKPAVSAALISKINTSSGVLLNWFGHGNPRVWAHEMILEREVTIPQFSNLDKLFFLTAATCDFGRFDNPDVRSGTEELLLSKAGGAIGAIAATRVVFASANGSLTYKFYNTMFTRDANGFYPRVGDIMYNVKLQFHGINDQKYVLFADPTMRLNLPEYIIKIDSINGISTDGIKDNVQIKALSNVKINASILNPLTQKIDNSFNGTAYLTMCDGDQSFKVLEPDPWRENYYSTFVFSKFGPALNNSTCKVKNGSLESTFIIPKDISFNDSNGRLLIYAYSNDNNYAKGNFNKFFVNGIQQLQSDDRQGPKITVYLDGRDFQNGNKVSTKPLLLVDLFDESGMNSTGLGIGHRIEAWIDNANDAIDFTSKYKSSLTDSRYGTVEDILFGLAPGLHKIKFRAWDVFNNFSIAEVSFIIPANGEAPDLWNLSNYPNPLWESTKITFLHNISPPFDFDCSIYSINGVLIRTIQRNSTEFQKTSFEWDGFDNSNNRISQGNYIYQITAKPKNGLSSTKIGILSVVK